MIMKKVLWLLLFSLAACAPKTAVTVPPDPALEAKLAEAVAALNKGCYLSLKRAWQAYADLYARPSLRRRVAVPFLKASILMAAREKDLGFATPVYLDQAVRLVEAEPTLAGFRPYVEVVGLLPPRTRGVIRDIDTTFAWVVTREKMTANEAQLREQSLSDEFAAYLLLGMNCSYGRFSEKWQDPASYVKIFPGSLLVEYRAAICGEENGDLLRDLLAREPEFVEAHFHLGELALREGLILSAERELLAAYDAIPESPQIRILLASIYLATEELDKSLEYYLKTLEVQPEYRDALLGQAICLSHMKRYDEAIVVLDRIIALGYWLLGESYYWLAWNKHELKRDAEALRDIDEAKGRLPTNSEVFSLAGTIGLELDELGRAEKDFQESLRFNPANTEALFGLGDLAARRADWPAAAEFFRKAATALEGTAAVYRAKIKEIEAADMAAERKARLVARKTSQLASVEAAAASAHYETAVALFNAGKKGEAEASAERAAAHPATREKAAELLRRIRG
jgi:tetratricopeptide (TPR) repeat protein